MQSGLKCAAIVLATALLWGGSAEASPFTIGAGTYAEVGPTEIVTAVFNAPTGGISTATYHGLVKLVVSGTGQSLGTCTNDAFYVIDCGGPFHGALYYQLAFDSIPLVPLNPARDAKHFIVYDIDANAAVTPTYVPAYRSGNTYSFIVDTGLLAGALLHFGTSNGIFADNTGAYRIEITQLAQVPEPVTLLLFGTAAAVAARLRRRV
jgi:hypothetical protein